MGAWGYLFVAILLEIAATFFLKLSHGFERWSFGALSLATYGLCFWVMAPALKVIPVGVAYAIWSGLGIIGATLLGFLVFREVLSLVQVGFIALILIGAVGLKVTTG